MSSTPVKTSGGSSLEDRAKTRTCLLFDDLTQNKKIWVEHAEGPSSPMMESFLNLHGGLWKSLAAELPLSLPALKRFVGTFGNKADNEKEFEDLVSDTTSRLVGEIGVRFVRSLSSNLVPRSREAVTREDREETHRRGLKPDFFTSKVRYDLQAQKYLPSSISAILSPSPEPAVLDSSYPNSTSPATSSNPEPGLKLPGPNSKSAHDLPIRMGFKLPIRKSPRLQEKDSGEQKGSASASRPTTPSGPLLHNDGSFTWEDVQVLFEIKNISMNRIDKRKVWGNMILKAAEVLRYQWYRKFVLGFLVCQGEVCMFRVDRSCVLVSQPVDIGESKTTTSTLVSCILASLVLPHTALGFPSDDSLKIEWVEDKPRLVVSVCREKFVLDKQISSPSRDRLISRATTAYIATRIGDNKEYCYKSSWPYASRQHEGEVLHQLQEVPEVVRLLVWDSPSLSEDALTVEQICEAGGFLPYRSSGNPSQPPTPPEPSASGGSIDRGVPSLQNHAREHRQTVTEYIPNSFYRCKECTPLELLCAWRSLYRAVGGVTNKGWVHRDLSWNNARLRFVDNEYSAVLIDFDLAARIVGETSGTPDRTGTPAFMPLEVLEGPGDNFRHQELHEDECAFWVGLFTIMACSIRGREYVKGLLEPRLEFEDICKEKVYILYQVSSVDGNWLRWMQGPQGARGPEWDVVRDTCEKLVGLHFRPADLGGKTCTFHSMRDNSQALHAKLLKDVDEVLASAIDVLRERGEG